MKNVASIFQVLAIVAVLLGLFSGCGVEPVQTEKTEPSSHAPAMRYALTYYYCIEGDVWVSERNRQLLDSFGKLANITPAAAATETYTDIPEFENNAKGTDPICILLPDLDLWKYRICSWRDTKTGITTSGWYRIIGDPAEGMMTDEFVTYDVDSAGTVTQYETVNLGKYDSLGLDESRLENLGDTFSNAIYETIGTKQPYQHFYTTTSQTTFRIFTDSQDRIVITTTITLDQGRSVPLKADLYAVVE